MKENGVFRRKNGFTITSNSVARNKQLSLKAKGLYLHIMSYITCESFNLTKTFLLSDSLEGEKAFDNAWNELKGMGYLKVYFLRAEKGRWITEYELLEEPTSTDVPHTYYCDAKGVILSTNFDRQAKKDGITLATQSLSPPDEECHQEEKPIQNKKPEEECMPLDDRTPQKGVTVKTEEESSPYPQNGTYRYGSNGNGGNNNNTEYNTDNNTIQFNSFHFRDDEDKMRNETKRKEELQEAVCKEVHSQLKVPYWYNEELDRMREAVHLLTDWETQKVNYQNTGYYAAFEIFNEALITMCCSKELLLKKQHVTYVRILDKINLFLARQGPREDYGFLIFESFCEYTVKKFLEAVDTRNITDYNKYMQSMIWDGLSKYEIEFYKSLVDAGL